MKQILIRTDRVPFEILILSNSMTHSSKCEYYLKEFVTPNLYMLLLIYYSWPIQKIRIPMASLEESSHNMQRLEVDRSTAIDAAIVRIMKARKILPHQELVAEVLAQLLYFQPDSKVNITYQLSL
jgi:hypothetical protein